MKKIMDQLNVGATVPFTVIHVSDTHLTLADERDCERKNKLSKGRAAIFPQADKVLEWISAESRELGAPIMHTGDLIDFVSVANLERVKQFTDENDCFVAAGNHEFSLFVGEAKEDAAYRNQSLHTVQQSFKNDIRMSSRVINGVNFVALDNGYYLFEEEQLKFLKGEAEKGMPIVLLMHNPIFEQGLYDHIMELQKHLEKKCASLVAVPEELMQSYAPERFSQQRADEVTKQTVDYIKSEPLIKAVLTGHVHFNYEGELREGVPQLVVSTVDMRVITVK